VKELQKENSELHIKCDFLEDELKDYKDTLKENDALKAQNNRYYQEIELLKENIESKKSILEKYGHID
jgi:cell shape-determining protein MreC